MPASSSAAEIPLAPFTEIIPRLGPLILYLLRSVLALLVDRPMLWLIVIFLAVMIALSLLDRPSLQPIHSALASVVSGEYGLACTLAASVRPERLALLRRRRRD